MARLALMVLVALACSSGTARAATFARPPTFPPARVGEESAASVVALPTTHGAERMGAAALSGDAVGDYKITANKCSKRRVRTRCRIWLAFRPTAPGVRTALLRLDGSGGTAQVALSAVAGTAGRMIAVEPAQVSFGEVTTGYYSRPIAVTVRNTGDLPLSLSEPKLRSAEPQLFTVTPGDCFETALAPGATCDASIQFTSFGGPLLHTALLEIRCAPDCTKAVVPLDAQTVTTSSVTIGTDSPDYGVPVFPELKIVATNLTPTGLELRVNVWPRFTVTAVVERGRRPPIRQQKNLLGKAQKLVVRGKGLKRGRNYTIRVTGNGMSDHIPL